MLVKLVICNIYVKCGENPKYVDGVVLKQDLQCGMQVLRSKLKWRL